MPSIAPKFGTLSLDNTAFYNTARWDERIGQKTNEQEAPCRHGAKMADQLMLTKKMIPVRGQIIGSTASEARTKLAALLKELFSLGEDKLYLWDDRYVNASLKDCSTKYVEGAAVRNLDFILTFLAADPFQYEVTPVTGAAVLTAVWSDRILDQEGSGHNLSTPIGNGIGWEKLCQTFLPTKNVLSRVQIRSGTTQGAPGDNVVLALVLASDRDTELATHTIAWSDNAYLDLDVQWDYALDDSLTYGLVLRRSGALDAVNYRRLRYYNVFSYPDGRFDVYNGVTSAWQWVVGPSGAMQFRTYGVQKSGNIVLATGNAPSPPTFHITAPGGTPIKAAYLKNPHASVDKWCEWFGTVAPTKELIIAMAYDERGAENDSVDAMDGFWGLFYNLAVGTNSMLYEGSPCTITVDYSDRWF